MRMVLAAAPVALSGCCRWFFIPLNSNLRRPLNNEKRYLDDYTSEAVHQKLNVHYEIESILSKNSLHPHTRDVQHVRLLIQRVRLSTQHVHVHVRVVQHHLPERRVHRADASAMSGEHVHFCTHTSSTRSDVHHLFKKHTWSSATIISFCFSIDKLIVVCFFLM